VTIQVVVHSYIEINLHSRQNTYDYIKVLEVSHKKISNSFKNSVSP